MAAKAIVNFGKYKGQRLGSLPINYLKWMTLELDEKNGWKSLARQVLSERVDATSEVTGGAHTGAGLDEVGSMVLTFGKYKGQALGALPSLYLEWMATNMHTHWGRHAKQLLDKGVTNETGSDDSQSSNSLSSLKEQIQVCQANKDLTEAKKVHARVSTSAYRNDRFVSNLLVDMYGVCSSVEDAVQVFVKIKAPNIFSWNVLLKVYTHNGWTDKAWEVFHGMPEKNIVSWNIMLAVLASEKGNVAHVREFFDKMPNTKDVFSWTTLLNAYTSNGKLEQAKVIFDSLDDRNVNAATRNTMMEGYVQQGHIREAREIFDSMQEKTVVSWNLMIAAYGRKQDVEEARKLFDRVTDKNQVTWNAMLAAYAQNGYLDKAMALFNEMPREDSVSWTCLIQAHCLQGKAEEAEELLERMSYERTMVHWTMLLQGYSKAGKIEKATEVYHRMPVPDVIATNTMLSVYVEHGYMHEAFALFEKAGDKVDTISKNIIILAYAASGDCDSAKKLFDGMLHRDIYSWTCLYRGLTINSLVKEALYVFRGMVLDGWSPNEEALVHALAALGRACTVEETRSFFANMSSDYGVSPSLEHYDRMVATLGDARRMAEARELINNMPFEADARIWMSLLSACRRHADAENGKACAEQIFVLDPRNVSPYIILAEIYSQTGKEKDIAALKKAVKDKGLSRVAAESLIHVGGKTHRFTVGDKSHPNIKQVRKEVARLTKLMEKRGYSHEKLGWNDVEGECRGEIHSEKLAVAYGVLTGSSLSLVNSIRMCSDCHRSTKLISELLNKRVTVLDCQKLHEFSNGACSCGDAW